MTNKTNKTQKRSGLPRTTLVKAVQKVIKNYTIDMRTGRVFNKRGAEVGGYTYEPRITVHLEGKKYNARLNKVIGFMRFGPVALHRGVSVRHRDGNKFNNAGLNLELAFSRAYARRQKAA